MTKKAALIQPLIFVSVKPVPWWQFELRGYGNRSPGPTLKGRHCGAGLVLQLACPLWWLVGLYEWSLKLGLDCG